MSLLDYIPSSEEVSNCIRPEAETVHEAVLLAVHQETPLSYRLVGSQEKTPTDEKHLLSQVLTKNVPSGALVIPITGASGAGKSHLVRVIDARLRNSPDNQRHHIIRIPKSASLRRVVNLILEALPGDARYSEVKTAFDHALAEVDVESAVIRLAGELEITLGHLATELQDKVRTNRSQTLLEQLDHAKRLPLLFRDAVTAIHFRQNVFPRIVQRAVAGSQTENIDPTKGQFSATDLDLPEAVNLGRAAREVGLYYRTALAAKENHGKRVAADVLNQVIDQATRQLFKLHGSLGGMTLQDVILEIRKQLLKDGKDLVLLVEDFAALTGIQDTLAKVLIQEGIRDGEVMYCTMRSVIAVTDGYLVNRDTLATRARGEWIVESAIPSEEEVLRRTGALVASYLNAARWGEERLKQRYKQRKIASGERKDWLPNFAPEDVEDHEHILKAFDYEQDIPLFPFNRMAIESLAGATLKQGDALVFNPRFVINNILQEILQPAREAFKAKQFPPVTVITKEPSAEISQWLSTRQMSLELRERFKRIVVVWGNNPDSISDLQLIPKEVYEAFGMPVPTLPTGEAGHRVRKPKQESPVPPRTPSDSGATGEVTKLKAALEQWVQGTSLLQVTANAIRKALASTLNDQLDWNAERCLKTAIEPQLHISIPNASGEGHLATRHIKIAPDNSDPDGRIRGELLSLLRVNDIFAKRSDYEEYEEDLARIANLVDRLMPQALEVIRANNLQQAQMAMIAQIGNSRIFGMAEKGKTPNALSTVLFSQAPVVEVLPPDAKALFRDWLALQQDAVGIRPKLISELVATCGCFQGTGVTPNGVDIARLVEHYPSSDVRLDIPSLERLDPESRQKLATMRDDRVTARLRTLNAELVKSHNLILEQLGDEFDKNAAASALKELTEALQTLGAWDVVAIGSSPKEVSALCEQFRSTPIKEVLDQIGRNAKKVTSENESRHLLGIANLQISPLLATETFIRCADAVIKVCNRHAENLERQIGDVNPGAQSESIRKVFTSMQAQLQELDAGGKRAAT